MNTESFLRGRIGETIQSNKAVPFDLPVSVVPENTNQYITISPDTVNEEIFYYTTKTGTAGGVGTVHITARGFSKKDASVSTVNQKEHTLNAIYKGALNHIILAGKANLEGNNTFNGFVTVTQSLTVNGDTTTEGMKVNDKFQVPVFTNAIERDLTISLPVDGMVCYQNDIEEFLGFKNNVWQPLGTGGGGSAVWYQDSTADGTITGAINGTNTVYTLSHTPGVVDAFILTYNGQVLERGATDDYQLVGKNITMNWAPAVGKLTAIYPDQGVGTQNATTRATTIADSVNGELYRATDDSNSLHYKDNGGDDVKILDITTNKIPGENIDLTNIGATETTAGVVERATDTEATTGTDTTRYITPKQLHDNIKDSIGVGISKNSGTNYQATESGFVTAYFTCQSGGGFGQMLGYIGNSNPASTLITASNVNSANNGYNGGISFPVKKGYWYRVDISGNLIIGSGIVFTPNI